MRGMSLYAVSAMLICAGLVEYEDDAQSDSDTKMPSTISNVRSFTVILAYPSLAGFVPCRIG